MTSRSGFTPRARRGHPRRPFTSTPIRCARRRYYARGVLGLARRRRGLLRRQAVLRLRARERAHLSVRPRRDGDLDRRASHAGRGREGHARAPADRLLRRADALRVAPRRRRRDGQRSRRAPARLHLGRRGLAAPPRRGLAGAFRLRHPRRDRLDRAAPHLSLESPRRGPLRHDRPPGPRLPGRAARRRRPAGRRRRRRVAVGPRRDRLRRLLEQPRAHARDLSWAMDADRRPLPQEFRWHVHLLRAQRRHAQGRRDLGLALRGRVGAARAPRRPRGRRGRPPRSRRAGSSRRRTSSSRIWRPPPPTSPTSSRPSSRHASRPSSIPAGSSSAPSCPRPRPARSSVTGCGRPADAGERRAVLSRGAAGQRLEAARWPGRATRPTLGAGS